eukprot:1160821-Pelagomonas_calceolata.AAC.1
MDACCREKLQEQGIEVPENISRDIPEWAFPNGSGPSAQHQSRPDAVFVRPIPGRATHLNSRGSSGRGVTGGKAVQSRRRRVYARRRMADSNPPDPH